VINGGSNTGKTTLIKSFQDLAFKKGQDYWRFGTDCAYSMLQPCLLNLDMRAAAGNITDPAYFYFKDELKDGEPFPIFECGPKFMDFIRARYRAIKCYLELGYNIIADEVAWNNEYINILVEEYQNHPIILVKVFVRPEIAKQREEITTGSS
jgi:chloramphenicol 3-O-phosphotransferase